MDKLAIRIKLEALITEREGMVAENKHRENCEEAVAYDCASFTELSDRIFELLNEI